MRQDEDDWIVLFNDFLTISFQASLKAVSCYNKNALRLEALRRQFLAW